MDEELLQQLCTVQKYISTLFDSLPEINTTYIALLNPDVKILIEQNISYGKKIIDLSEKFTAKYRKDHFVDRKDIEQKIGIIFQHLCPNTTRCVNLDQKVNAILKRIDTGQLGTLSRTTYAPNSNSRVNSINPLHFATKDSKMQEEFLHIPVNNQKMYLRSKMSVQNLPFQPSDSEINEQSKRKNSINKSKVSRKSTVLKEKQQQNTFSTKNVLQIKSFFQDEEKTFRKIFEKFGQIIQASSANFVAAKQDFKISKENKQFTKCSNESEKNNIKDFVHANVQNSIYNLNKIFDLIDVFNDHFSQKSKIQGYTEGKLKIYIQQINKREQVFSFTVSKLQQNLQNLKQLLTNKNSESSRNNFRVSQKPQSFQSALELIEILQQISIKFYDIYPSHSNLKNLKVVPLKYESSEAYMSEQQMQKRGYKNQETQVNLLKAQKKQTSSSINSESKRTVLQLFKLSARIGQMIEKFERANKYRKNIEQKQVQKLMESIRQAFPKKNSLQMNTQVAKEISNYHDELKRIVENNQKNQKQLSEDFNKKCRKYQKSIQQLQKTIQTILQQHKKQLQKNEGTLRKVSKKLQAEKQQSKKALSSRTNLQKNIKDMGVQISRLQKQVKEQRQIFENAQKHLINTNRAMQVQICELKQLNRLREQNGIEQSKKMQQQCEIYRSKIIFLETQQQSKNQQFTQIKVELEDMIKQNKVLKKQVQQFTDLYEEKIKQLDILIQKFQRLQDELKKRNLNVQQLKESLKIVEEKNKSLEKQKLKLSTDLQKIKQNFKNKEEQLQKFKQTGALNENDISVLKQQMDKLKYSYIQCEQQLQQIRAYAAQLQSQKQFLIRQNKNYRREVENYNDKQQNFSLNRDKMQKQVRELIEQITIKKREIDHLSDELSETKKQLSRFKKQCSQVKDCNTKLQTQLRCARQQLHKKSENQSLETGKRKLQLQSLKMQLRRKNEQFEKSKQSYEQKIQMLDSKIKQMSQFITHKQLLNKITNSHLSQ